MATAKKSKTESKPKLTVVKSNPQPAAEKMMAKQLDAQLVKVKAEQVANPVSKALVDGPVTKKARAKPTEASLAVQAMEYADRALAYGEFLRRLRNGEQVDGGLVSAAVEFATSKATEEAGEQFAPLDAKTLSDVRQALMMNTHPFGAVYREAVTKVHELRTRLHGAEVPQRVFDKLDLVLGAAALPVAEKLAQRAFQSAEFHYYAEWARGKIVGVPSAERANKEAKSLDSLADFLNGKGLEVKAKALRAQAEELRADPSKMAPPPREMDLSKLSKTEALLVNFVKNAGGSVTTEILKDGFAKGDWSVKDMSRMMDLKVLSTPREGVVRLDESKLMPPENPPKDKAFGDGKQGPPRKSHAIKTPKADTPHKWQSQTDGSSQCLDCKAVQAKGEVPPLLGCKGVPKAPRPSGANKPIVNPEGLCLCGCGAATKTTSRFGIGHDAKLHSAVLKAAKGDKAVLAALPLKRETTVAYLKQAPWMTPEVLKAIGL